MGTLDARAAEWPCRVDLPGGYWFEGGRWLRHAGTGGGFEFQGWSELSVKFAIMGLNPPVLAQLATRVIQARQS